MKRTILVLLMFAVLAGNAQEEIFVKTENLPSSLGIQPVFSVEIPQARAGDAITILERTLVPRNLFSIFSKKPKFVQEKDEWIMRDVSVSKISNQPLTVYAQVLEVPGRIFVRTFFQEGDRFIGTDHGMNAQTEDAVRFMRDYAVEVYRDAVGKELKTEEAALSGLEQELRRMGRQQSSNERKIKKLRTDNADMANEIREYEMRIGRKQTFLAEGEDAQSIALQHEADAKKLEKDILSNKNKIRRNERKISKFDRRGNQNLRDQKDVLNQIDLQRIRVNEVKTKLSNIR